MSERKKTKIDSDIDTSEEDDDDIRHTRKNASDSENSEDDDDDEENSYGIPASIRSRSDESSV